MITNNPLLILFLVSLHLFPLITAQVNSHLCHQTCFSNNSAKSFSYPFGFSSGCGIRLKCTADDGIFIGNFPVKSVSSDSITVSVKAQCNRPLESFRELFSHKYAPTSRNALLLQNCSQPVVPCFIPTTMVQTHFESPGCRSGTGNLTCYFENASDTYFMSYLNLMKTQCQYFMSSISAEHFLNNTSTVVSLEVETIELGWWLEGDCQCSQNANCTKFVSPVDRKPAYRCQCKEGFAGDGYLAGNRCRKGQFLFLSFNWYFLNNNFLIKLA